MKDRIDRTAAGRTADERQLQGLARRSERVRVLAERALQMSRDATIGSTESGRRARRVRARARDRLAARDRLLDPGAGTPYVRPVLSVLPGSPPAPSPEVSLPGASLPGADIDRAA